MHATKIFSAVALAATGAMAQSSVIVGQEYYSTSGCIQNPGPITSNITVTQGAVNTCLLIRAASQPAVTLPSIVSEKTFLISNSSCSGEARPYAIP